MRYFKFVIFAMCSLATATSVVAQPAPQASPQPDGARAPGELRQARQQQRIANGVASGRLTPAETARLERQQARVDQAQSKAVADGKVTPGERERIDEKQDRASRKIHHKKHNARTAG
jgi:hypothetical protein